MLFGIYSEIQHHGNKPMSRQYEEVIKQIIHADRLQYDCYTIIEHFFFPQFSISANPWALFAKASTTAKRINFRTLGHPLPYYNPTILASQIAEFDLLVEGRYEFGLVRGHGWLPPKAGLPVGEIKGLYDEALEVLLKALHEERFSYTGTHYNVVDSHIVPRPSPDRNFRIFLGGTSDRTYELAGEHGWAVAVPPLLPYEALRKQLDIYRQSCADHGHSPDIVWIHACHLDENRETALREGESWLKGFLIGNASPLLAGNELAPAEELLAAGYGFYVSGIMEDLARMDYDEIIRQGVVWAGTPDDIVSNIQEVIELCPGLTEIDITVNAGGASHWMAIKTQELFHDYVMPHFRNT